MPPTGNATSEIQAIGFCHTLPQPWAGREARLDVVGRRTDRQQVEGADCVKGICQSISSVLISVLCTESCSQRAPTKLCVRCLGILPGRIRERLDRLAEDPYAHHPNVARLQSRPGYRLRVGDWRVIYEVEGKELVILVLRIGSRGEVYR